MIRRTIVPLIRYSVSRFPGGAEALLRWLLAYPLLTGQILLMLMVSWAGLGEELGAERLFWHEDWKRQFSTGLAVGMLYGVVLLTLYIVYRPTAILPWLQFASGGRAQPGSASPPAPRRWLTLFPSADPEVRLAGRFLLAALVALLLVTLAGKGYAARKSLLAHRELVAEFTERTAQSRAKLKAAAEVATDPNQKKGLEARLNEVKEEPPRWTYLAERGYLVWHVVGYLVSLVVAWALFVLDERVFRSPLRERLLDVPFWTPFGGWGTFRARLMASKPPIPSAEWPLHGIAVYLVVVAAVLFVLLLGAAELLNVVHEGWAVATPVAFVALVLILFSLGYGLFAFYLHRQRLIFGGGAVCLLVWNSTCVFLDRDQNGKNSYKLQFPGLTAEPPGGDVNLPLWNQKAAGGNDDVGHVLAATEQYAKDHLIPSHEPLRRMCERWQKQQNRPNEKPRIVIICTSGGGIRAAMWTGAVLHELDKRDLDRPDRFRDHIRLFTGASGGMVGATLYVADFDYAPAPAKPGDPAPPRFTADHVEALGADSLTRTAQSLVLRDMLRNTLLPPWAHAGWDRGRTLERMWELRAAEKLNVEDGNGRGCRPNPWCKTFAELRGLERDGKRPSLIYSPLMVEDARRLLISNLDLSGLPDASGLSDLNVAIGPRGLAGRSAVEFHRLFPDAPLTGDSELIGRFRSSAGFKVVTAARMNATFPVISPAVSLPTNPPRRLVDAGIYDNYGVNLAAAWMLKNEAALRAYTSGVALVQIRAFPLHDARNRFASFDPNTGRLEADPSRGDLLADTLAAVSAPAEALLAARANAAFFRNAEQIEVLHRTFNQEAVDAPWDAKGAPRAPLRYDDPLDDPNGSQAGALRDRFFVTTWFELRRPASLNWYLSEDERVNIRGTRPGDAGPPTKGGWADADVQRAANHLFTWFGNGGK